MNSIFELARFNILKAKYDKNTKDLIPDALAYAWCDNVYPIMHDGGLAETLKEEFEITEKMASDIFEKLAEYNNGSNFFDFYTLESNLREEFNFLGDHTNAKSVLIRLLKYLYIDGNFSDEFWDKLFTPGKFPIEAKTITKPFCKDDCKCALFC